MTKAHEHRGCRIRREHGPVGLIWCAYSPGSTMRLTMEPSLAAAKAELDRLWEKGVRWFLGERHAAQACEACGTRPRLCDWCDAAARHFLDTETKPGEASHACDSCVHLLLKIPAAEWDANADAYEDRLGAYCPNTDCHECDPWL